VPTTCDHVLKYNRGFSGLSEGFLPYKEGVRGFGTVEGVVSQVQGASRGPGEASGTHCRTSPFEPEKSCQAPAPRPGKGRPGPEQRSGGARWCEGSFPILSLDISLNGGCNASTRRRIGSRVPSSCPPGFPDLGDRHSGGPHRSPDPEPGGGGVVLRNDFIRPGAVDFPFPYRTIRYRSSHFRSNSSVRTR